MRTLPILLALLVPHAAHAQAWTVGEVTPTWNDNATWTAPIAIDSPHPADTYEPAAAASDNVLYTRESWVLAEDQRQAPGTAPEAKFRTHCKPSFIKRADPILYRGQHPAGHGHTFFGPNDPYIIANVEDFDYAMGRAHPASACPGGPLNATLYWEPSIYDDRHGLRLTVMPAVATFYYTIPASQHEGLTHLRRNIRFIGGANPADYNDTARRAEYTAAGMPYPGRVPADGTSQRAPAGFNGITCYQAATGGSSGAAVPVLTAHKLGSGDEARYLKGPGGEDPWGGGCSGAGEILILVNAPDCWDGTNLSSPDGRDHFRYSTSNEVGQQGQCPMNYVKVPHFETKVQVNHNGWEADLQYWYLSSDRMNPSDTPGDPASYDPCRQTGPYFCSFATAHFDWWGAWDDVTIEEWQRNCVGITIDTVANDHADCGFSGLAESRTLKYSGAPPEAGLSSDPVNSLPDERASDSTEGQRYFPVRPEDENQDALTLEVHPHG